MVFSSLSSQWGSLEQSCQTVLCLTYCFLCGVSQLPNGVTYHPNTHQDRLGKLQEHLRMLSVLFRKLRLVYDKCNENCAGMDPIPPEVRHFPTSTFSPCFVIFYFFFHKPVLLVTHFMSLWVLH